MSSQFSMYVVPDNWKLKDCMCVAYMTTIKLMLSDEEFDESNKYESEHSTQLYDELVKQPCMYAYTSTDGDPDHEKIMRNIPLYGRLYRFNKKAYELAPSLLDFLTAHKGKRYICMN